MTEKKSKLFFFFLLLLVFVLGASFIFAQRELEVEYPTVPGVEVVPKTVEGTILPDYVRYIFNFAIWIVGALAFGALVYGGIKYLTSAGSPIKMREAKDRIFAAFLGLIILFSSYLILTTINPQLVIFEVSGLKKVEVEPAPPPLEIERITSSINVELPVETRLRGIEGKEFGIFEPKRLERVKDLAAVTEEVAIESEDLGYDLEEISHGCKCDFGCDGCVYPECRGYCEWVTVCETECDDEGNCVEVCREECENHCRGVRCHSDPCCEVRSQIDANKAKNRENIEEFKELKKELDQEIIDLKIEVDRLEKALKIMKEGCPLYGVLSRDEFISLKDYYAQHDWKSKKIRYWDEIQTLIPFSFADFYCPVGGTRSAYTPPESEIPLEELEKTAEEFEKYLAKGGEFEVVVSCSRPIPFGEIMDEGLGLAYDLITKMKEFVELQQRMIEAIDELHKRVSECTSDRCSPVCNCSCCEAGNKKDGQACECTPCRCKGSACPWGAIGEAAQKIEDLQKEITEKKAEIEKFIDEDIPAFLNGEFKKMAERFHYCISVPEEIEPGWLLLDCGSAIGTIGPDGKIFEKAEECYCGTSDKCKKDFPELFEEDPDRQCSEDFENCYEYNFFCCRIKD